MGLDYSYQMWVPEERLYKFLKVVQQNLGKNHATIFDEPDGRSAKFFGSELTLTRFQQMSAVFYAALPDAFMIPLLFELDEVLSESEIGLPTIDKYEVGPIWLSIELSPLYLNWLENEETFARVCFFANNSPMSEIFLESSSIRRGFINLARSGGASSCCIDVEEDYGQLIFIDGREVDEKIEIVDKQNYQIPSLREMRFQLDPKRELSDNENKLSICQSDDKLSVDDVLVRLDWAKNSENSGVRGAAIKSLDFWIYQLRRTDEDFEKRTGSNKSWLSRLGWQKNRDDDKKRAALDNTQAKIESTGIENAMCEIAIRDSDWRVRYVATHCLDEFSSKQIEKVLSRIANDENQAVRTMAAEILTKRHSSL